MRVEFFGTGDYRGLPVYGCRCGVCLGAARERRYQRQWPCIAVGRDGTQLLLNAGHPGLMEQFPAGSLLAVLLSDRCPEHTSGLYRLRNEFGAAPAVYAPPVNPSCGHSAACLETLSPKPLDKGVEDLPPHWRIEAFRPNPASGRTGFRLIMDEARLAYLPVALPVESEVVDSLHGFRPDLLIMDCNRRALGDSVETAQMLLPEVTLATSIDARQTLLTGLGHEHDLWLIEYPDELPPMIGFARDGLAVDLTAPDCACPSSRASQAI